MKAYLARQGLDAVAHGVGMHPEAFGGFRDAKVLFLPGSIHRRAVLDLTDGGIETTNRIA
nr:hypothetical protein [Corynebacterium vitaeruminis]